MSKPQGYQFWINWQRQCTLSGTKMVKLRKSKTTLFGRHVPMYLSIRGFVDHLRNPTSRRLPLFAMSEKLKILNVVDLDSAKVK